MSAPEECPNRKTRLAARHTAAASPPSHAENSVHTGALKRFSHASSRNRALMSFVSESCGSNAPCIACRSCKQAAFFSAANCSKASAPISQSSPEGVKPHPRPSIPHSSDAACFQFPQAIAAAARCVTASASAADWRLPPKSPFNAGSAKPSGNTGLRAAGSSPEKRSVSCEHEKAASPSRSVVPSHDAGCPALHNGSESPCKSTKEIGEHSARASCKLNNSSFSVKFKVER